MSSLSDLSIGWLPVEVAKLVLDRLSPIENCQLSQTNRWWRTQCSTNERWRAICQSRFQLNDITTNGFKKLAWTYPGIMSSWKDWFAFRSQFRREVAGAIEIEVLEVVVENGEKVKRIPSKNLTWDLTCLSQPPQSVSASRGNTKFHFDEYHTLIQGEIYENRSWFYTRTCIGTFSIPVFQAKQTSAQVWIDLEEPLDSNEADTSSQADSECAVLSDDDFNSSALKRSGTHENLHSSSHISSTGRQVHYDMFDQHFAPQDREEFSDDGTDAAHATMDDDAFYVDAKSDHSNDTADLPPRGRRRLVSPTTSSSHSRSVPTSPKRSRTSSVKSSSSAVASSSSSSALYLHSGPHSPTSSITCEPASPSRPSSPPYSPSALAGSPFDLSSPRDASFGTKRKSGDMKSSKEIGADASNWFTFLSTSPPITSSSDHIPPKRISKRVLLQLTMTPVICSVQDFEIVASISHGALNSPNELFLVKDKDSGQPRFMKIVPIISHRDDDLPTWEGSKEAVAYSTTLATPMLAHPFLVEQLTSFQMDSKLYMMMEWLGGGELFSVLRRTRHGRFDEHEALFYTAELVLGLEHMHHNKIIYRDLKPENLLLSAEGHLKITQRTPPESHWAGHRDFSIVTGHSMPEYLAPEILKGLPYSTKADSWSVGTILYNMLVGQPPFHHPNVHNLFAAIIGDEVVYPSFLSSDVISLLKGLLHRDVKKRFSLKQTKSHEWFDGLDWTKMLHKEYAPPLKPFRRQDLNFGPAPSRRRTPQRGLQPPPNGPQPQAQAQAQPPNQNFRPPQQPPIPPLPIGAPHHH